MWTTQQFSRGAGSDLSNCAEASAWPLRADRIRAFQSFAAVSCSCNQLSPHLCVSNQSCLHGERKFLPMR